MLLYLTEDTVEYNLISCMSHYQKNELYHDDCLSLPDRPTIMAAISSLILKAHPPYSGSKPGKWEAAFAEMLFHICFPSNNSLI